MAIKVSHLTKYYRVYKKDAGLLGSLKSLMHRKYETVKAVDDVSFSLGVGELVGFIGPNGAGKTTSLKCLSGLLMPSSGCIKIMGFTPFERKKEYLRNITLIMGQKNQLIWDLPPVDTFLLNKEIYQIPDRKYEQMLNQLSDLLDVGSLLKVQSRKLSLGERMKMELIAALIHQPKIIFLDEPTLGLDVVMQKKVRDFIRDYNKTYSSTILLTSHYMEDVQQLAGRVIIINEGKIIYDGKLFDLVKKFARNKILSVILAKYIPPDNLTQIGKLVEYNYPKAVISVSRNTSNIAASQLLEKFPVKDLNIEEPSIEDVIRDLFSTSS